MTNYIHQLPGWPNFYWDYEALTAQLADIRHRQGRLLGCMESIGFPLRLEAILQTLTMNIIKTSETKRNLTSTKWAKPAKCSQDTAARDIADLIDKGILQKSISGARSTNNTLV